MNLVDFQSEVFDIIHTFSGQANKIVVNTVFIDFVEDLETGLFLSQLVYWSIVQQERMSIFIKLIANGMRKSELVNTVFEKQEKLEEMSVLKTYVKKANGVPTVHYKLDKKRFFEMMISFCEIEKEISKSKDGNCENELSLTDITTDTTTNIDDDVDKHP